MNRLSCLAPFHSLRRAAAICFCACLALASIDAAAADDYPNKPIKMLVPNAAGGPTDIFARILADAMSTELGQPVVVENRTGAGGMTAFATAARSVPNGYTLVIVDPALTILPSLHGSLPYDLEKDLTPISLAIRGTTVLVARKSLEASTPTELVALARRSPGKLTYGSAGIGSANHLNAELFNLVNDISTVHVPYQGGAPGLTDLAAGRIDIFFINVNAARPFIESGGIKALAVGGKHRTPTLPNVPTYYEANLPIPQFDIGSWWGIMGPANLPPDVVGKLNAAIGKALKNPQLIKRFAEVSAEVLPSTPAEFAELIAAERRKWADVVKRANVQAK